MGCCCSKTTTFETFPEDGADLEGIYKEMPWKHRHLCTDLADVRIAEGSNNLNGDPALTVAECLLQAARKKPNAPALRFEPEHAEKKGFDDPAEADSGPRDTWKTWTWREYADESKAVAKAIIASGINSCDGVGIWGFNSPYWILAATSAMISGAVNMGIYPTDTDEIVAYKIKHCNCQVIFVESAKHQKVIESLYNNGDLQIGVDSKYNKLKAIIVWTTKAEAGSDLKVYSWEEFKSSGSTVGDQDLEAAMKQSPGKVVNYCYTSGTTGLPKAVMLTNDNLTWNCKATLESSTPDISYPAEIRSISYLPLSHVAATMLDICAPMCFTAGLMKSDKHNQSYWTTYFARPYDLKKGTIVNRLKTIRPIVFLAVPRVWEKIEFGMRQLAQTGTVGDIIASLKNKNVRNAKNRLMGGSGSSECCTCLANMIGNMVRKKVGLDESLFNITGAAPIRAETLEYFASIGLDIFELYGMSEMTATSTCNKPGAAVWGTIGGKMDGIEVGVFDGENMISNYFKHGESIPESAQGEIRVRGRNIMMGYMANPELGEEHVSTIIKKNEETINASGWIMSGDKGAKSVDGMFKITGRYKELIITAGGENVAPIPLESNVKVICGDTVSNIMMFGDKRPYNIALVSIRCQGYTGELLGTNTLEKTVFKGIANKDCETLEELIVKGEDHPVIKSIIDAIKATNKNKICCPSRPCMIQKFTIIPQDFSVEHGELTPTLKLKRSVVAKKYADLIQKVYDAPREALYIPSIDSASSV